MSPVDAHYSTTAWEIRDESHCGASSGDIVAHHVIISESGL